jgi:hypothetical protein
LDIDRFFLETLDDLESRAIWGASEYSLLRASALLRELLIDERPLVHQVNRKRQLRLRFGVRQAPPRDSKDLFWLGIDPSESVEAAGLAGGKVVEVGVPQLLGLEMLFLGASTLTARDLITLGANVQGGVHHGPARDPQHRALQDFSIQVSHGRTPIELVAMIPISHVLLAGLEPLRSRVRLELPELPPDPGGRVVVRGR